MEFGSALIIITCIVNSYIAVSVKIDLKMTKNVQIILHLYFNTYDNLHSLNLICFELTSESVRGSKSNLPARAMAVTSSGDVTKAWVAGLASLRPMKLRLYDVTMVFFSPFFTSWRSHCPMHGPHALAKTVPPNSRRVLACQYTASFNMWLQYIHSKTYLSA